MAVLASHVAYVRNITRNSASRAQAEAYRRN